MNSPRCQRSSSRLKPLLQTPLTCCCLRDIGFDDVAALLARYGLAARARRRRRADPRQLLGRTRSRPDRPRVHARDDTPVHSLLHEAAHLIVLPPERARRAYRRHRFGRGRRRRLRAAVAARRRPARRRPRALMADMDAWGYTFRLGSARAYFERDAEDAGPGCSARGLVVCRPKSAVCDARTTVDDGSSVDSQLARQRGARNPGRRGCHAGCAIRSADPAQVFAQARDQVQADAAAVAPALARLARIDRADLLRRHAVARVLDHHDAVSAQAIGSCRDRCSRWRCATGCRWPPGRWPPARRFRTPATAQEQRRGPCRGQVPMVLDDVRATVGPADAVADLGQARRILGQDQQQ